MGNTAKMKLMYFYAYWDGNVETKNACIDMCRELNIAFEVVDCESESGVKLSCKYGVKNCPTVILFDNGVEVLRCKGNYAVERIKNIMKKH